MSVTSSLFNTNKVKNLNAGVEKWRCINLIRLHNNPNIIPRVWCDYFTKTKYIVIDTRDRYN